ncbi:MAG: hypothetical protein R3C53_25550 [Pirellulaceae bacterium]
MHRALLTLGIVLMAGVAQAQWPGFPGSGFPGPVPPGLSMRPPAPVPVPGLIVARTVVEDPNPHSPLHCAAERFHQSVLEFQAVAGNFAPSPTEKLLANNLVPKSCSLVDATECGVPWATTMCEAREAQAYLSLVDSRVSQYCAAQLHPEFALGWQCVVESWTDVVAHLSAPATLPEHRAARSAVPVPILEPSPVAHGRQDTRFQNREHDYSNSLQRRSVYKHDEPHRQISRAEEFARSSNYARAYPQSQFDAYGYDRYNIPGAESARGELGAVLVNTILQRLLER